jgi:ATP-dependent helicase HrpA
VREHFVIVRRVRDWLEIHSQLHSVVAVLVWRLKGSRATYEQLHL